VIWAMLRRGEVYRAEKATPAVTVAAAV